MRRFFVVPGAPVGKARARVVTQGGYTHSYTPEKTALYERLVADTYKFTFPGEKPLTGPVELILRAFLPVPESWAKSKKAKALAGIITPTVKPDADNLAKSVCDALNGVAWIDDKQVIKLHVIKAYGVPRVEVEIWDLNGESLQQE
jgi:Holliday junction resolvase RusA-like endonuclease